MGSTIRVNNWPIVALGHRLDGCIEHRVDEFSVRARPDGPADDQAIEAVDDGRQVHLAGRDLELCDVGEPLLVRGRCLEVAMDEVLGRWTDLAQIGPVPSTLWLGNEQALLLHQSLNHLLRDGDALPGQRSLQPAVAVAAVVCRP